MAELMVTHSHSRGLVVVFYRNEPAQPWKELVSLLPIEAVELSRQLEACVSGVRLELIHARVLPEKTLEHKTGREI